MAQYTNSTPKLNDWELYFQPFPYSECLVVLVILFYGLRIQLQKLNHQRNVNLIKKTQRGSVAHVGHLNELVCLYAGL